MDNWGRDFAQFVALLIAAVGLAGILIALLAGAWLAK